MNIALTPDGKHFSEEPHPACMIDIQSNKQTAEPFFVIGIGRVMSHPCLMHRCRVAICQALDVHYWFYAA